MKENCFKLLPYEEVLTHVQVLNARQVGDQIYLEIPHDMAKFATVCDVTEIKPHAETEEKKLEDIGTHAGKRVWIKLYTQFLNLETGHHLYRISLCDARTNAVSHWFFAYRIQTDNPDRSSYLYMQRRRASDE